MPQNLPADRFELRVEAGRPSVVLHDVRLQEGEGWSFLNRATLLVVDGPGDEGFLLRRLGDDGQDLAPDGWDEAVASASTVEVVAGGTSVSAAVVA
jgi:hypothetical protein